MNLSTRVDCVNSDIRGRLPCSDNYGKNNKNMLLKDIEEHWSSGKVEKLVRKVSDRIHDKPVDPWKNDFHITLFSYPKERRI